VKTMGDRGQIKIVDSGVFLYTHWRGNKLFDIVKKVILRGKRLDDVEYLTRIIFCEMVKDEILDETGYGIGTSMHGDLDNPLVEIDVKNAKVIYDGETYNFGDF